MDIALEKIENLENRISALENSYNSHNHNGITSRRTELDGRLLSSARAISSGTTYKASSNVIVFYSLSCNTSTTVNITFKTDGNSTPTTVVWTGSSGTSHGTDTFSFTYFVPRGNYYLLTVTSNGASATQVYQEISLSKYHD